MARPWLSFDVETSGELPEYALQPHRVRQGKAWLTTLSTSARNADGVIQTKGRILYGKSLDEVREILRAILVKARDDRARILGWNTPFDCAWVMAYDLVDLAMECEWLDGMQVWKHVDMEPSFVDGKSTMGGRGLKRAVQLFTNQGGYEYGVDYHDMSPENLRKLMNYNMDDTEHTLRITEDQWALLDLRRRSCVLTEAACIPLVARANLEGMPVDTAAIEVLDTTLDQLRAQLHSDMSKLGVTEDVVRSPAKLATLLFKKWGLPILKENPPTAAAIAKAEKAGVEPPPGKPSTDKEVLHELAIDFPNVEKLGKWRESMNLRGKFVTKLRDSIEYNGDGNITRPNAVIFGTYTTRLTYASKQGRGKSMRQIGFALHQMKNDKRFRGMLIAPEGHDIVEADAAGQEFRWMAIESGDETMLGLCMPGEDAHSYMTAQIQVEDYRAFVARVLAEEAAASKQRKMGKVANLCIAEGTRVLTDRGFRAIEDVRLDDKVWDGVEFVNHAGLSFSGVLPTMTYDGLTATHEHKVFTIGHGQQDIADAARHGWLIEPAMGSDWTSVGRSAVRIMDGVVRRAIREARGALCQGALRLWAGARSEPCFHGARALDAMQGLRGAAAAQSSWSLHRDVGGRQAGAETCQRDAAAMHEPSQPVLAQLRRAWDTVSVRLDTSRGRLDQGEPAARDLPCRRDRPRAERWSLRAWKLASGDQGGQPRQSPTRCYDIVDCGPRHRFVAAGLIVHNSLQYRTSKRKLRVVARVQYGIPMTEDEAELIHGTYRTTYPGVPIYWSRQIARGKHDGYIETLAGTRLQINGDWTGEHAFSMQQTCINYPIQGVGGQQKYLALRVARGLLPEYDARLAWDLHDGLYFFVPKTKSLAFAHRLKATLDTLPYRQAWGLRPPIPLPFDVKLGTTWGSLRGVEFK